MMKMDWEESPPPSRVELLDKGFSTTQSSAQFQNHFQHQHSRFITSSSSLTSIQNNYQQTNSSSNNSSSNGNNSSYRNNHQVINLSESGSKSGFSNHLLQHFSSSSTNTSPSGSSTSSSPPPLLSTSYESASSLNPPTTTSTPSPSFGLTNNHSTLSGLGSSLSPSSAKASTSSPTTTTSTNSTSSKRNKPIPPPLDLSIGAANLSLHSNDPDSSSPTPINLNSANPINGSCLTPNFFERPCYYLTSPKFNQAEKTLPLRKRWHSWSPLLMNSQMDPMLPLYAETGGNGSSNGGSPDKDQTPTNTHSNLPFSIPNSSSSLKPNQPGGGGGQASNNSIHPQTSNLGSIRSHSKSKNNELQTPTPFYTPNEQSPKFMNSPVFSYSTPDTSLYQGPFSPIRTSNLFPPILPSSPFNLNTPTFIMPNTNGAHSNSQSSSSSSSSINNTLTVPVPSFNNLVSNSLSTTSSQSSSSSSSTTTFSTLVPSTLLSPASSQASSSNSVSYEDLHEKSSSNSAIQFNPIWNIFFPGTRIRFVQEGVAMDWHLVDILDMKDDYAPHGLEVRTLVVTCSAKERIQMTLCPVADPTHPAVEVNCDPGHPFMVEKKGWCAVNPEVFFETHGIRCQKLMCGDICVKFFSMNTRKSPHQHVIIHSSLHSDGLTYNNYSGRNGSKMSVITGPASPSEMDMKPPALIMNHIPMSEMKSVSPLAHIPISVVKQKPQLTPNPPSRKKSGLSSNTAKKSKSRDISSSSEPRGRRPMNAFLLFAKDKRPELIQMYPGKDNRSISVLLGEAWQSLGPVEKEQYASNARAKAEEQKRMHPDCWKRKKAQSSSSASANGNNNLSLSNSMKNQVYSPISIPMFQNQMD